MKREWELRRYIVSSHAPEALFLFGSSTGFIRGSVRDRCARRAISCVLAACRDSRPAEVRLRSVIRCGELYRLEFIRSFLFRTPQTTSHGRKES